MQKAGASPAFGAAKKNRGDLSRELNVPYRGAPSQWRRVTSQVLPTAPNMAPAHGVSVIEITRRDEKAAWWIAPCPPST